MNSAWFLAMRSLWIFSGIDFSLADVTARTRVENEPFSFLVFSAGSQMRPSSSLSQGQCFAAPSPLLLPYSGAVFHSRFWVPPEFLAQH